MTKAADNDPDYRKAKPTKADLAAAKRLRKFWDEAVQLSKVDPEADRLTQERAGEALEFGQSAVSQYLNGTIPLNYLALVGFAKLLNRDPSEIRDLAQASRSPAQSGASSFWRT